MDELLVLANDLFTQFNAFAKSSPVVAGIFGLWGAGFITMLFRGIPTKIWAFVKRQSTTSLTINNEDPIYHAFLKWTSKKNFHSFIRTLNFNNGHHHSRHPFSDDNPSIIAVGYGFSFFFFERHLFFMTRHKEEASNTKAVKEVIDLTVVGRNHEIFKSLYTKVCEFEKEERDETKIWINNWESSYWEKNRKITKRPIETIILNKKTKVDLFDHIDKFINEKDWYFQNGIPYRTGIMLSGPPGTGKTSLLKSICSYYNKDLHILSLNGSSDKDLLEALSNAPNGSIIAIEDIDAAGASTKRVEDDDDASTMIAKAMSGSDGASWLSLSGLLNGIDGVSSGEDIILIATTNHPEKLDPALMREGRFDLHLNIGYTTDEMINEFFTRFFPDFKLPEDFSIGEEIAPCKIQKLIFDNKHSPENVLEGLKELGK